MESKKEIVIIGSGLGGLLCGAIMSKEGYTVTVLDMNKQIGGNLQTFVRDKHIFDSGIHYVGGLSKGQNLYKIFNYLGMMDKLKIKQMDESAFDKIVFYSDKKEYNYAQGFPLFIESLVADFPNERPAIEEYCKTIKAVCNDVPLYNLLPSNAFEVSKYLQIDTKTYIESLTSDTRLQNVLAGSNLLYAGIPNKTPFYTHALVINSYVESSWKFEDGGSQMARILAKIITNAGGKVKTRTQITKIHVDEESKKAEYAEDSNGNKYYGDYFISNIHPTKTLELTDTKAIKPAFRNRIKNLDNSLSAFVLNITLKPNIFLHQNSNYYCFMEEDVWNTMNYTDETWPKAYALFYSQSSKTQKYSEGITIMTYMGYNEVQQWENTFNTVANPNSRGEDYEAFKKQKAEKMLAVVYEKFPELKDAIINYYASTPLTFRDYMGTDDGSIYGVDKDYRDPLRSFVSPHTKVDNLLLTGQNINLHGVLGVTVSSLITCSFITGLSHLLNKIEDAQKD